jgi:hypothetical protein
MNGKTLILGIDPGLTGAVAVYDSASKLLLELFDMPTEFSTIAQTKKIANGRELAKRLLPYSARFMGAVFEDVASRPNQSSVSTFSFGLSTGIVLGVLQSFQLPIHKTPPSVWKMLMGCTASKLVSRIRAASLFPEQKKLFDRAKDDGRAEAALMAKFGEKVFKGELFRD